MLAQIHRILTFLPRKRIWHSHRLERIILATTTTALLTTRIFLPVPGRALIKPTLRLMATISQHLSVRTLWLTPTISSWYYTIVTQNVISRDVTDVDLHSVWHVNIIDWTSKWYWKMRWDFSATVIHNIFSWNSTCVSRCPPRSFPNQGGVCWACHESCETCGGAGQDSCLTCAPAHLYVIDLAVCLQTCPDGYFESKSNNLIGNTLDKWWFHEKIAGGNFSTSTCHI